MIQQQARFVLPRILSKNILGTFYLPQLVFCISETFLTLLHGPKVMVESGLNGCPQKRSNAWVVMVMVPCKPQRVGSIDINWPRLIVEMCSNRFSGEGYRIRLSISSSFQNMDIYGYLKIFDLVVCNCTHGLASQWINSCIPQGPSAASMLLWAKPARRSSNTIYGRAFIWVLQEHLAHHQPKWGFAKGSYHTKILKEFSPT